MYPKYPQLNLHLYIHHCEHHLDLSHGSGISVPIPPNSSMHGDNSVNVVENELCHDEFSNKIL